MHFNYTENYIDNKVCEWHKSLGNGCSLHEFLGFTRDEYKVFVEKNIIPFRYNIIALFKK